MSRLPTLLSYYIDSRKVTDVDSFKSLILADKIKNMLSEECLNHVLSIEATVENGWLPHDKLAEVVEVQ